VSEVLRYALIGFDQMLFRFSIGFCRWFFGVWACRAGLGILVLVTVGPGFFGSDPLGGNALDSVADLRAVVHRNVVFDDALVVVDEQA